MDPGAIRDRCAELLDLFDPDVPDIGLPPKRVIIILFPTYRIRKSFGSVAVLLLVPQYLAYQVFENLWFLHPPFAKLIMFGRIST
jgi:hypothetical protein